MICIYENLDDLFLINVIIIQNMLIFLPINQFPCLKLAHKG